MSWPWLMKRSTAALEGTGVLYLTNWLTHESLHKIHLGRACQPVSHHFYGIFL
jgi:hypothetical protein